MFVEIPVAIKNKRSVHRLDEKEQQKVVCVHIGGGELTAEFELVLLFN